MNKWYASLNRPPLTPPNWVFGPVWSVLYAMIATSLVIFVKNNKAVNDKFYYPLIGLHLTSNFSWTALFFKLKSPGLALVDIVFLVITLMTLIYRFWKVNKVASVLLFPYLIWVLFATYLNLAFYILNRA